MNVLITGASGFLGKNQLLHCRKSPWKITPVYFSTQDFPNWLRQNELSDLHPVRCDLTNASEVREKLRGDYDVVIHFAANGDPGFAEVNPVMDLRKNTETTINLLKEVSFKRFIYFSSGAVYHGKRGAVDPSMPLNPTLSYAISNLASERYVASLAGNREYLIVRFFGAYGPHEPERKIYSKLARDLALKKQDVFTVRGDGKSLIDAMYVSDASDLICRMAEMPIVEKIVDAGSGTPISINDLVNTAAQVFERKVEIRHEGSVPEYIEFHMNPAFLKKIYDFSPRIDLPTGLKKLKDFLALR